MASLGDLVVRISADASQALRVFRQVQQQVEQTAEKMKAVGTSLRDNVTVPLVGFGTAAVLAAGQNDRLTKSLIAVTGSSEEATRQLERLRVLARAPGLGFAEAVQASVQLQAIGLSASTAERSVRLFANAVATTGGNKEDLAEIVRQYTQILSLGKVTAENVNVIKERAPAAAAAIQQAFAGVDLTTIPVEQFTSRLLAELERLPQASASILEPFTNGLDDVKAALVPLGEAVAQVVTPLLAALVPVIQDLSAAFAALSPETQKTLVIVATAAALLGPVLIAFGALTASVSTLIPVLGTVGVAFATLGLPVVVAVAAFAGFVAAMVAVKGGLGSLNEAAAESGNTFGGVVTRALASAANAADSLADKIPGLFQALASLIPLGPALAALFESFRALDEVGKGGFFNLKDVVKSPDGGASAADADVFQGLTDTTANVPKLTAAQELAKALREIEAGATGAALKAEQLFRAGFIDRAARATQQAQAFRQAYERALDAANGAESAVSERLKAQAQAAQVAAGRLQSVVLAYRGVSEFLGSQTDRLVDALRKFDQMLLESRNRARGGLDDQTLGNVLDPVQGLSGDEQRDFQKRLAQVSEGYREAAKAVGQFADSLAETFSGAVVDSAFAFVQIIYDAEGGLRALGEAGKAFAQGIVTSLRDVLVELGRVIVKALILKGILALANIIVPGSGAVLGGLISAGGGGGFGRGTGGDVSTTFGNGRAVPSRGVIEIPYETVIAAYRGGLQFESASGRGTGF